MSFKYFDYLGSNRRPSPKQIGAKLRVDERTVRLRTRRMEKEGFIQYYQTIPNLRLFNQPLTCLCNFQTSLTDKPRILDSLRNADHIVDIADFFGESFGVTVSASTETDAHERAKKLAQLVGLSQIQLMPSRSFPMVEKSPSRLEWRVVKTMRYDAQRPTASIAKELGITYRMADYTIRKLLDSRTASVRAIVNARDSKGIIFYSLSITVDEQSQAQIIRELRKVYGERVWWMINPPGPMIIMFLFANSIGRVEDDLVEALSKTGVRSGSTTIFKGWVEPTRPSWIDMAIGEKIGH